MELRGNAKEAFEKWFDDYSQEHHQKEWLDNDLCLDEVYLPDELKHALIIEWLDSVCIYVAIGCSYTSEKFFFQILHVRFTYEGKWYKSRQQAAEKAIEKAIEIYNLKHK